jgi:hypothetical protein
MHVFPQYHPDLSMMSNGKHPNNMFLLAVHGQEWNRQVAVDIDAIDRRWKGMYKGLVNMICAPASANTIYPTLGLLDILIFYHLGSALFPLEAEHCNVLGKDILLHGCSTW